MILNLALLLVVFTSDGAASTAVKGLRKVFGNAHWCDRVYGRHSEQSDNKLNRHRYMYTGHIGASAFCLLLNEKDNRLFRSEGKQPLLLSEIHASS